MTAQADEEPRAGPVVLGHRGYPTRFPENTLLSFLAAIYYGADGIEFDVWSTADGVPVIHHDRTTLRTAGESLDVTRSPYAVLKRVYLGKGQCIPRLEELLSFFPGEKLLMAEIKDPRVAEKTLKMLEESREPSKTFIVSFDIGVIRRLSRKDTGIMLGVNFEDAREALTAVALKEKAGIGFVGLPVTALVHNPSVDPRLVVERLHRAGLRLMVWSPLELDYNPDFLFTQAPPGIDIVLVNDVGRMVRELRV